jgi:hypothetical protein
MKEECSDVRQNKGELYMVKKLVLAFVGLGVASVIVLIEPGKIQTNL